MYYAIIVELKLFTQLQTLRITLPTENDTGQFVACKTHSKKSILRSILPTKNFEKISQHYENAGVNLRNTEKKQ